MKTNTSLKQPESYLISEEEMLRRLGITEADLVGLRTWKSNSDSIYPTQSHG